MWTSRGPKTSLGAPPSGSYALDVVEEDRAPGLGRSPSPGPKRTAACQRGHKQGALTPVRLDNGHGRHRHFERINLPQIKICSRRLRLRPPRFIAV